MKTYFLADAHLGSRIVENPREHERKLVAFLDSIKHDAAAIYFLGDMFDFWFEYKMVVPKGFTRFLGKLGELSDMGIELHYFTGNHDIWTFGYLETEVGMQIHREPEIMEICGKKCFLAHGDGLYTDDRKFMFVRKLFHSPVCQKLFRLFSPRLGVQFGLWWSEKSRRKVLAHENRYEGEQNEWLVRYAKFREQTEHFDYYIFGHRHIMLDLQLATRSRVVILGDFISLFSYAAMDEDGQLVLETIA